MSEDYMNRYYVLRATAKQKTTSFKSLQLRRSSIINVLKKGNIIPNEQALIESNLKPFYNSKKKMWTFSLIFALVGREN